ncbi:MAG: hypothetical protein ACLQU3_28710 [Limisphaerales bacterium]
MAVAVSLGTYLVLLHPAEGGASGASQQLAGHAGLLLLFLLFAWRIYTRFRRMVGRQRLSKVRLRMTLAVYTPLIVLLCFAGREHPERLLWLAGGLGLGFLLGLFGLKKTRFEPTQQGLFYTPHAHLGIFLSLLFAARIAYRLLEVYAIKPAAQHGHDDFARSPITLVVFGLLAGYYITYAIGLLRWRNRLIEAKRQREALKLERGMADA